MSDKLIRIDDERGKAVFYEPLLTTMEIPAKKK